MTNKEDTSKLGELVSSHRHTRRSKIFLVTVGLICVLGGVFLGIAPWAFPEPAFGTTERIVTGVVGAGIAWVGFVLLHRLITHRRRVVQLFQHGLADRFPSRTTIAPFEEVESIQSQRLELTSYGVVRTKNESHILRLRGGDTIKLDHFLEGMNELGNHLENEIAKRMVPLLRQRLAEGGSVSFGPVELAQKHVAVGCKVAGYGELASVSVQEGWVLLYRHGHPGAWRRLRYGSLKNAQSFLTLLRERVGKA